MILIEGQYSVIDIILTYQSFNLRIILTNQQLHLTMDLLIRILPLKTNNVISNLTEVQTTHNMFI